ncbi:MULTISPECIES: hypothetical protein [unclassified Streptomyces]|uniref:hypothetical protein n=1 Tax=unclassified Streptomyces TaxID=2593676 RepID=UPI0036E4D21A
MEVPESLGGLREWLERNGVPHTSWGTDGTKTVRQLYAEIEAGETTLEDDPPLRRVDVVTLRVRQGGRELVETSQLMSDGTVRRRNRPPAEKIVRDEDAAAAALRCVAEELGVEGPGVVLGRVSRPRDPDRQPSPSYPGLPSAYVFHEAEVQVPGLPASGFWTRERGDGSVFAHLWEWR